MIRLIGSIFVYQGIAWQTFGYNKYRPLGGLKNVLKIYDQHGVDEIIISVRTDQNSIDLSILREIRSANISTPVIYSGGVKSVVDVRQCLLNGVDRIGLNTVLFQPDKAREIIDYIGVQGVVSVMPFLNNKNSPLIFNCNSRKLTTPLHEHIRNIPEDIELLFHDMDSDGFNTGFSWNVCKLYPDRKILVQGGVIDDFEEKINEIDALELSGIVIENRLLWSECSTQIIKKNNSMLLERL